MVLIYELHQKSDLIQDGVAPADDQMSQIIANTHTYMHTFDPLTEPK